MKKLYFWDTRIGTFYIVATPDGRFHPYFSGETLGSYINTAQAAEDLAGGHTYSVTGGIDTAKLGIPDDINEWHSCAVEER